MNDSNANTLVSVIVPALPNPDAAARCLDTVLQHGRGPVETIVLADAHFRRPRKEFGGRVKIVEIPAGSSPTRLQMLAMGLKQAGGETIVWLDPDYLPGGTDWLARLTSPLDEDDVGAVTGLSNIRAAGKTGLARIFRFATDPLNGGRRRHAHEAEIITLRCDAFRAGMLRKLSLEDGITLPRRAEPVELSLRIRRTGSRIICRPDVEVERRAGAADATPEIGRTLLEGLRYGEADAVLARRWGVDWVHGRLFMAAIISLLIPLVALVGLPYATVAAGLLFAWGWFFGFHIPLLPWEWPVALVNGGVFIALILAVRNDWAPGVFPPRRWHPAIIRQWLFVFSMPLSYLLATLCAGFKTALGRLRGPKSALYLPILALLAALWHLLSGIGYARETFFSRYREHGND